MKHSKILPLMFGGALAVCWGATGCALSTPSGGEETASEQQAWTTIPGDMAFASSTNTTGSAPADSAFSLSSGGGTINVSNIGTGQYRVDIPNLGSTIGGHVQVMARGLDLTRCKVGGWGSAGSTLQVFVNCFSSRGTPANSIFAMNYVRRDDHPGPEAAYVYAFSPSSSFYDASSAWSWNSTGGPINISHTPGTGTYSVQPYGQDLSGGTVEVTAYGGGNAHCKVVNWSGSAVNVACFDGATGAPVESIFTMIFSKKSPNGTASSSYAWANDPSSPSYVPATNYQLGLLNVDTNDEPIVVSTRTSVQRWGVGQYRVTFPAMASIIANPANVKVTAYGSGSETCKAYSWGRLSGANAYADVICLSASGAFVDTRFTITYSSVAFTVG